MSQWTHVCGCVRIDSFNHVEDNKKIPEVFGKILQWDDNLKKWEEQEQYPDRYTPTGSEGGIEYSIWENPKESHMTAYTISIWGDLRDYEDGEEIIKWFRNIVNNFMIRDAVLNVEVEGIKKITASYIEDDNALRIIADE